MSTSCAPLSRSLSSKSLSLSITGGRASTRQETGKAGLPIKNGESEELQPTSEIENSALHYSLAVGNFQQITSAKHAAKKSLVELAIRFSAWEVPRR